MRRFRKIMPRIIAISFLVFCVTFSFKSTAQDGEQLFKTNCANCHKPDADFVGPKLQGVKDAIPYPEWIYDWVHNPSAMIVKDAYAKKLADKWKPIVMTSFSSLTNAEIDAIMKYVDDYKPPTAKAAPGGGVAAEPVVDNSMIFGILTLILAIVAFILLQINKNLRHYTDEKEGIKRGKHVPFYRNKTYLMIFTLLLFMFGGYLVINAAIGLGHSRGYEPKQPIFYSHQVHAGVNQISCLYCHGGAEYSKQAGIPSVNVCMNCHMAIKEYKGEPIVREDGTKVDGTAEIQKLYQYAGWNPDTKTYNPDNDGDGHPDGSKPIEWVKIHNLPDHVYFNHSQHVVVGKQACQTCHGNIQEMPEVYQFAPLSMGWCINCHRQTKVDFFNEADSSGNKFYSIYEKFHRDLANHKLDSVTVETIGGTECQKCHY